MCKFIKVIIDRKCHIFRHLEYLPQIILLYERFSKYLNDDYFACRKKGSIERVIELIEKSGPYFWVILDKKNNKFSGFVFLDDFVGNANNLHSAQVTTCFIPEYWGYFTKKCAKKFIKYCFKNYTFKKLKAYVFPQNVRVKKILNIAGFTHEATLRAETLRNGQLQDIEIFSILKNERNTNEN